MELDFEFGAGWVVGLGLGVGDSWLGVKGSAVALLFGFRVFVLRDVSILFHVVFSFPLKRIRRAGLGWPGAGAGTGLVAGGAAWAGCWAIAGGFGLINPGL